MTDTDLYRMIGELQAGMVDLKTGQANVSTDLKDLRKSLVKCQLKSHGIAPVLSGAGLGGLIGGIAGYFGKLFT
jgi:hypothetical protein